ncbi:hypothetical protein OF83DRAFT_938011 [Amylostereum chailletii]|nr:hypothetical protein OF83DRAFT_938011 [Amylostereum chailletii]
MHLFFLIHMFGFTAEHPEIVTAIMQGPIFRPLAIAVRRQGEVGQREYDKQNTPVAVFSYIRGAFENQPVSACLSPLIQRYGLFKTMSHGATICVDDSCPSPSTRVCTDFIEATCRLLAGPSTPKGKTRLRHALKKDAREHWLSTFSALRQGRPSDPSLSVLHQDLVNAWTRLGNEAGLSFQAENERHRRSMARLASRMCYDRTCEFNGNPSATPHLMMRCKGCRSVQYCDRACQKNDWYEGRHRETCRGQN